MSKTTTETVEIEGPDGAIALVEITIEWSYERNPFDKERAHYRGEDDGWIPDDVTAEIKQP